MISPLPSCAVTCAWAAVWMLRKVSPLGTILEDDGAGACSRCRERNYGSVAATAKSVKSKVSVDVADLPDSASKPPGLHLREEYP